jgi:hypothetical protein
LDGVWTELNSIGRSVFTEVLYFPDQMVDEHSVV